MNLKDENLKRKFKSELTKAINYIRKIGNPDAKITFEFNYCGKTKEETLNMGYGSWYYKNVYLPNTEIAKKVFLKNLGYNVFAHTKTFKGHTNPTTHGFGEYWGTTYVRVKFTRKEEKNANWYYPTYSIRSLHR